MQYDQLLLYVQLMPLNESIMIGRKRRKEMR